MPYIREFLPNMLDVFGLDAGFMPEIPLKGDDCYDISFFISVSYLLCCPAVIQGSHRQSWSSFLERTRPVAHNTLLNTCVQRTKVRPGT